MMRNKCIKQASIKCVPVIIILLLCVFCNAFAEPVQTSRQATKPLTAPQKKAGFRFSIFADRTGGEEAEAVQVWGKAIRYANRMRPEFVMTVGDLVQGYEDRESWLKQMDSFFEATSKLTMPWYPAAGNHDVYWYRDTEGRPNDHHESDYETHFGPLWYAFEYQNCWFIVLFTDEGNLRTGEKDYNQAALQTMSDGQFTWLKDILGKAKDADHVFVFLHHPRWKGGNYGDDWNKVHRAFVDAGNVSAVFAGHDHRPDYRRSDGIDYYILGTTGGSLSENSPIGHLFYWVSVQPDDYDIIGIPLNSIVDPKGKE